MPTHKNFANFKIHIFNNGCHIGPFSCLTHFNVSLVKLNVSYKIVHCIFFVPFTDVTNVSGRLLYWVEWANGGKFVENHKAVSQWPRLVKEFLEPRLTFGMPSGVKHQVGGKRKKADDDEPDFYVGNQIGKH